MKAIILCAGYGTRMEPYTNEYQKVMIPLHGKPILEYLIQSIKKAGMQDFIIVVGYRKEQIIDYFNEGKDLGVHIEYVHQDNLNGTGGALLLCEPLLSENSFFLTWGDTLVIPEIYEKVIQMGNQEKEKFVLVANYVIDPFRGAAIYLDGDYCKMIIEKPKKGTSTTNLNNAGIFVLDHQIFKVLKTQKPSERGEIEVPETISFGIKHLNWKFRVIRMKESDFYADFGDKESYEKLKKDTSWLELL
jgi:UDP-N-acetylglucosamine diphosphorylase / glucose-1-phosphate thymidylyltransferase / UDP-N-acetylgalactosamine diphosphorylase / glucosamine-1-phosphate N-acetyltransferase / galactosamine-1-phosphate N-acetyltransferase